MKAPQPLREKRSRSFNHRRIGGAYRATTPSGTAGGEYLGMEARHGDRAILLRHHTGTESIPLRRVTSIQLAA